MQLTNEFLRDWLDGLRLVWLGKDIDALKSYFSEVDKYYEDPFSVPVTSLVDILGLWEEVKSQDIDKLVFDILAIEGATGIVHWHLVDQTGTFDGIYVIKFNQDLNCTEFRQWSCEKIKG